VVERDWFGHLFAGGPDLYGDLEDDFAPPADLTLDDLERDYRAACRESAAIVSAAESLDSVSALPHPFFRLVTLRWLHLHMLRERHFRPPDILREETDGQVGDDLPPTDLTLVRPTSSRGAAAPRSSRSRPGGPRAQRRAADRDGLEHRAAG
jgi:hypothetical protein